MKKYYIKIITCSFLLYCCDYQEESKRGNTEPISKEEPEKPIIEPYEMPCECVDEWFQEELKCNNELPWDYPIKPKTEEWEKLQLGKPGELEAALQIPESILSSLSTKDLAAICMQYPLLRFVAYSDSRERELDLLFEEFNGIRELFQREDVVKELLKQYRCMIQHLTLLNEEVTDIENSSFPFSISALPFDISALELILSRYQSPEESNNENYIKIVQHLVCGNEKMYLYPETFGCWYITDSSFAGWLTLFFSVNIYSRSKILIKIDKKNLELIPQGSSNPLFLKEHWLDEQTLFSVNDLSCQYITN